MKRRNCHFVIANDKETATKNMSNCSLADGILHLDIASDSVQYEDSFFTDVRAQKKARRNCKRILAWTCSVYSGEIYFFFPFRFPE